MKDLLVSFIVACLTLSVLAVPLAAQAQGGGGVLGPVDALGQQVRRAPPPTTPPPRLPDGTIDLGDGIWVYNTFGADIGMGLKKGETMPLLPSSKALMASRKDADDPENWCLPPGVLRYSPYPFRFIQNYTHKKPTHLYLAHELMRTYRQIFLDDRKHPPELDPTWFGHSIASYDKDTLVIDTIGFNDKTWVDGRGTPHTEQLHTVERWTRVDMGHLQTEVLIEDPGAFSRPFTVRYESVLRPATDELMEYICQENNQYGFASGAR